MDLDKQRRRTALHEAGHVVAQHRLGIEQGAVSIKPAGETRGRSIAAGAEHCWSSAQARDMAIAFCAGYGALAAAGEGESEEGAGDDFAQAQELIGFWGLDAIESIKAEAVKLMSTEQNRTAVERLAQELLLRETIGDQLLSVLLDVADGESSEEDLEMFLALLDRVAR